MTPCNANYIRRHVLEFVGCGKFQYKRPCNSGNWHFGVPSSTCNYLSINLDILQACCLPHNTSPNANIHHVQEVGNNYPIKWWIMLRKNRDLFSDHTQGDNLIPCRQSKWIPDKITASYNQFMLTDPVTAIW